MAEGYLRQGALAPLGLVAYSGAPPDRAGVTLTERAPLGQLALRGDPADRAFLAAVEGALGVGPPDVPNTAVRSDRTTVLWLGPDEWLATMPPDGAADAARTLRDAATDAHCAVVDVGHARGVIGVSGPHAVEVLLKGCHIDLHPRSFGPGACAQTTLARCHVLLHRVDDAPTFDVHVHRSFLVYAWTWLADAGRTLGVAVESEAGVRG